MLKIIFKVRSLVFLECDRTTSFGEVVEQMNNAGYRMAMATDLDIEYEEIPKKALPCIALFQEGFPPSAGADSIVITLINVDGCRTMEVARNGGTWSSRFRYAGVLE